MIVDKHPVAENIRRIRESRGWQQNELARRLGVKTERVSNWECKENNPTVAWIPVIAETLGCSIDELFGLKVIEVDDDELWYLMNYRELGPERRKAVRDLIDTLKGFVPADG